MNRSSNSNIKTSRREMEVGTGHIRLDKRSIITWEYQWWRDADETVAGDLVEPLKCTTLFVAFFIHQLLFLFNSIFSIIYSHMHICLHKLHEFLLIYTDQGITSLELCCLLSWQAHLCHFPCIKCFSSYSTVFLFLIYLSNFC